MMSSSIVKSNVKRKCQKQQKQQQQSQAEQQQQQKPGKNKFINKENTNETGRTTINSNNRNNNRSKDAKKSSNSSDSNNDMYPKDTITSIDYNVADMLPSASGDGVNDGAAENVGVGMTHQHSIQLTTACKSIVHDNQTAVAVATIHQLPSSSSTTHNTQKASNKTIKNYLIYDEMIKDVSKTINRNISAITETATATATATATESEKATVTEPMAERRMKATIETTTILLQATSGIYEHDYDYNVVDDDVEDDVVGIFQTAGAAPIIHRKADASKKLKDNTTTTMTMTTAPTTIVVRTTMSTMERPTVATATTGVTGRGTGRGTGTSTKMAAATSTTAMKGESYESKLTTMEKKIAAVAAALSIQKPTTQRLQNYCLKRQDTAEQSVTQPQSLETSTTTARTAPKLTCRKQQPTITAAIRIPRTTATTIKSKTENKCAYELPTIFSNERKLEVNTTREQRRKCHHSNDRTNRWISKQQQQRHHIVGNIKLLNQFEALEYEQLQGNFKEEFQATTAPSKPKLKDNKTIPSLAERKAKLKSDFFKDIQIKETRGSKTITKTPPKDNHNHNNKKQQTTPKAVKRLWQLRKSSNNSNNSNLRLNRTKDLTAAVSALPHTAVAAAITTTVLPALPALPALSADAIIPLSLVAQRKLDLKEKFAQQTSIKASATNCNKPSIVFTSSSASTAPRNERLSSRVEHLVQKFDNKPSSIKPITPTTPTQRKMIVNSNKIGAVETATTAANEMNVSVISLKPHDLTLEQRNSPLSDEGCNLGQSPYSSDDNDEDNESIRTASTAIELPSLLLLHQKRKDKVARSASSDSALGLELVDDATMLDVALPPPPSTSPTQSPPPATGQPQQQQRRMTLTVTDLPLRPALLPLAEPTALPDSTILVEMQQAAAVQNLITQTAVPSKVLLEERVVELPEDPRCNSLVGGLSSLSSSRRESAQSCGSDCGAPINEGAGGRRFVRTPSVVVSDYSDDVMCGITLEEIEYFRAQRMRRRHSSLDTAGTGTEKEGDSQSDVSAASSCSNLYYCGSTISALDGAECYINGQRRHLERKASDCSTCSVSGGEDGDDNFTITEQPEELNKNYELNTTDIGSMGGVAVGKDLSDLLAAQHLSSKRAKKVGLIGMLVPGGKKTGF